MERARARTKRTVRLQRDFERSRLEDDLVATAYEVAVPVQRRPLSSTRRRATNPSLPSQQPPLTGGSSA
jgi:hypothetical protein